MGNGAWKGRGGLPVNPNQPPPKKAYLRQPGEHKPSTKIEDIHLMEGWYLLQHVTRITDERESKGGIIIPIPQDGSMKPPNVARVIKVGIGCVKATVGDYVMLMTPGGNYHDDVKPMPLQRLWNDEDLDALWVVHEDNIPVVIPAASDTGDEDG